MSEIKSSKSLREFIKKHEGLRTKPYEDITGKKSIGYGDTEGDTSREITEEEANKRLEQRIKSAEDTISKLITRKNLTQKQIDTLVDMEYHIGTPKLIKYGFFDLVNSGDDKAIAKSLANYNKARDKETGEMRVFPGLSKRAMERSMNWATLPEIKQDDSLKKITGFDFNKMEDASKIESPYFKDNKINPPIDEEEEREIAEDELIPDFELLAANDSSSIDERFKKLMNALTKKANL